MDDTAATELSTTANNSPFQEPAFFDENVAFDELNDGEETKKKKKSKKKKKNGSESPDTTASHTTDTDATKDAKIVSVDLNNVTVIPERNAISEDVDARMRRKGRVTPSAIHNPSAMNNDPKSISFSEDIEMTSQEFRNLGYEDMDGMENGELAELASRSDSSEKFKPERRQSLGCSARRYSFTRRTGDVETYPADCYSFIAIHSPFSSPFFFLFGFTVWVFQIMFLIYMILNKLHTNLGLNGEVDNPSSDFMANFIPANVTELVRATQITAVLCYCMFADSSLKDCAAAVEQFPRFDRTKPDDRHWLVVFSCFLRFCQGFMAIFATFLLIVTTSDVIEIILNFAAVNFISTLDEVAFELAKWGKYGPALENEAKSIENRPIPYCIYRKYKHVRYYMTVVPIGIVLVAAATAISIWQESENFWVTQTLRVQFQDSTGLQPYSGCYLLDPNIRHNKRKNYNSYEDNPAPAAIGYCKEKRQWKLFKNVGDGEDEGGERNDPCKVTRENELAHSGATDYFDVSSSFDDSWFSASGTPLDLYFFESDLGGKDLVDECGSFLNNGKCDLFFNTLGFQYDGGDCCAATCKKTNCGQDGAKGAFGNNFTEGIGYRNCVDPNMVPLTINLDRITSSRNPEILEVTKEQEDEYFREKDIKFWEQDPVTPFFIVDCDDDNMLSIYIDKSMESNSETIYVRDGARCKVSVSNTTNFEAKWDNDPIWWVEYTVYHGPTTEHIILSGDSGVESTVSFHRVPECYFKKLEGSVKVSTAYSNRLDSTLALDWLINDKSGNSKCDDDFLIERFALAAVNFAAPISAGLSRESSNSSESGYFNIMQFNDEALWISTPQQCRWDNIACEEGSVETLAVRSKDLFGTISTSIGLLTGLRRLDYDANDMYGTIPTEIGLLTNLEGLDIDNQRIAGTIPTEFGNFVNMRELDLDKNRLTGTIPTEFGLMANANEFDLIYNQLTGPIPTEMGQLRKMKTLGFEGNMLQGTIPTEIGLMRSLQGLHFKENLLTGSIPIQVGDAYQMENLWLGDNFMTGTIPTEVGRLGRLLSFDLYNNDFRGTIPTHIGLMTALTSIDLRGNSFTGTIPSEIGYLTDLIELRLEGNNFVGTMPLQITFLQRLGILTTDDKIGGSIPADIKTLDPCILCKGEPYDLVQQQKNSENIMFYENGEYGAIVQHSCRSLLQEHWTYPQSLFSENSCNALQETCIACGSGPYQDANNITAWDNIFLV